MKILGRIITMIVPWYTLISHYIPIFSLAERLMFHSYTRYHVYGYSTVSNTSIVGWDVKQRVVSVVSGFIFFRFSLNPTHPNRTDFSWFFHIVQMVTICYIFLGRPHSVKHLATGWELMRIPSSSWETTRHHMARWSQSQRRWVRSIYEYIVICV